ncbi:MAG: transporter related protein [Acidobacteriaceae bacterium]|nr:transporter related protein [Acidobacteriaceae bacterium]
MKYQLVLQFHATTTDDFDELVALEDSLIENMEGPSEVDGHDFGADEFNLFILTDHPKEVFAAAEKLIQRQRPRQKLKAAYREIGEESFVILWPPNLKQFRIL